MKDGSNYSVLNTSLIYDEEHDPPHYVIKRYKPQISWSGSIAQLHYLMETYHNTLIKSGIPVPHIYYFRLDSISSQLELKMEYKGVNVFQSGLTIQNWLDYQFVIDQMLLILKKAKEANLCLDPHPKNFVICDREVFFVDIYPPYSTEFSNERLQLCEGEEFDIIKENLLYFTSYYLGAHFCGDFLSQDLSFESFFSDLYQKSLHYGLTDLTCHEFVSLAKQIRLLEDKRLEKGFVII